MIYNNILGAMGHTPMVRLNHMAPEGAAEILVKFEGLNVGGSIKTRTAYNMIADAEARGLLHDDSIIVEPTSGNQGIGLALIGAVKGYKTIIIMPDSVSEERRKLVRHYGAEVILVHDAGDIGACIQECLDTALKMAAEDPKVCLLYTSGAWRSPTSGCCTRRAASQVCGIARRNSPMGTIEAVCMSPERGTQKTCYPRAYCKENWGLVGDAHAGDWHRQVSLLSADQVDAFNARGAGVEDGAFGENLLVRGIDLSLIHI